MEYVFSHIRQRLLCHHFFSVEGSETSSINCHILMLIRHRLLLHLFFCGKNAVHLDEKCHVFCEWPHKKLNLQLFRR